MRKASVFSAKILGLLCAWGLLVSLKAETKPNFVFILVDDMPWSGTPVRMDPDMPESAMAFRQMPNIEKLAAQGMTFRNARSAAGMCAPSRCSIMTGMMTARHLYSGNGGFGPLTDGNVKYMSRTEDLTKPLLHPEPQGNIRFPSIGTVLQSAGYATAHFGKWHLFGGGPAKNGFDESDGETDNKSFRPEIDPVTKRNADTAEDPKYVFSLTQRATDFIDKQVQSKKPFFVQISHYATHSHYQCRPETLEKYINNPIFAGIKDEAERKVAIVSAGMAEDLDTSIGVLISKLKQLGVADNTFIIFTSDNGYISWNESYDLLRGCKWWLWDNGLRVPLIISGPGVPPASRSNVNIVGYDFLPTFADFAGALDKIPAEVDGHSFKSVLLGQMVDDSFVNRPLYFHYPHYRISPPCSAIIMGETKLLHFYEWPNGDFLYDLTKDMGERTNLASAKPELALSMHERMMTKFKEVGAYFPKPNPNADPNAKRYDPNNPADKELQSEAKPVTK